MQKMPVWLVRTLAIVLLIAFQFVIFKVYVIDPYQVTPPYNPLQDSSVQTVTNRVPDYNEPAVHLGDRVDVYGTKCNNSDDQVAVSGEKSWQTVEPHGTTVGYTHGTGLRDPGCTTTHYSNPMPQEVIDETHKLWDLGFTRVVWRITGLEKPTDKPNGVEKVWVTDNFVIVKD